jgi:hypothetical protein
VSASAGAAHTYTPIGGSIGITAIGIVSHAYTTEPYLLDDGIVDFCRRSSTACDDTPEPSHLS